MNDREMLELAAKAAEVRQTPNGAFPLNCEGFPWNPLTDDGDALRLAVKLGSDVQRFESGFVEAWKFSHLACGEDYGSDPCAATRRAIVRAAAEIGRNK